MRGWFHQEAFDDGFDTVDEILDDYLGTDPARPNVRAAAVGGYQLLAAGHTDRELGELMLDMGFAFDPRQLGFDGYTAFLAHVQARLARAIAGARP